MENIKKIEAALFIAARFLSIAEMVSITGLSPIAISDAVHKLEQKYEDTGLQIVELNGKYKMDVKQQYSHFVNALAVGNAEFSKAEQETLAVIAYKQPIKQSTVIKTRGNKAYEHIKKFLEYDLIKAKKLGHTQELKLSDKFYEYFTISKSEGNPITINLTQGNQEEIKDKD